MLKSSFLREAEARGFIHQCTDLAELDALLCTGPVAGYIGFDCTADSLHVGSLMQIMLLRLLARHNHKPVVLLGDGTTLIGDPSFRTDARQMLSAGQIDINMHDIRRVLYRFLNWTAPDGTYTFVNNSDWLSKLSYIDMLRDVGPHFSLNRMLSFDSVKSRRERDQGMSFLEFNYAILQSIDFRELYRHHEVRLQLGGSDQWANIISGAELVRRTDGGTVFGLTTPLIQTASGEKMGKTGTGTVWLNGVKLSPFDYWQFWRNTEDGDVFRFMRLFTDMALGEIEEFEASFHSGDLGINDAKIILACATTTIAHGNRAAQEAAQAAQGISSDTLDGLPVRAIPTDLIGSGMELYRLLLEVDLAKSGTEARKLVRGGGVSLAGEVVWNEYHRVTSDEIGDEGMRLSVGKKRHVRLMTV